MDSHLTIEEVQRFADGEAAQSAELERHLKECARCANAVLDAVRLKKAVRDAMRSEPASATLLRRLTARPHQRAPWWMAATAAIFAIAVAIGYVRHEQARATTSELADVHVTLLASSNPVEVRSTDRHTVKPWFEGRIPFAVPVPDLTSTPFRLIGGRVVYWRGNPTAYLLIGKDAHRISLFIARRDSRLKSLAESRDVNALSWQSGGLVFVAVADVPASDLERLREVFLLQR